MSVAEISSSPWRWHAAARSVNKGGVIAYPTEAVWGLGCDPFNAAAVNRLLKLKRRPPDKGLILIAAAVADIEFLYNSYSRELQQQFLQALATPSVAKASPDKAEASATATTWLLPHNDLIPPWIVGTHSKVAIRVTQHAVARRLCQNCGGLLVSTSANPAGLSPAKNLLSARAYFGRSVDVYVPGKTGNALRPSAIIDLLSGRQLR